MVPFRIFRQLKAKRAVFSKKGRSLSLASFTTPVTRTARKVVRLPIDKLKNSGTSPSKREKKLRADEKYLEEYKAQGELESVGLESLINLNDVKK